MDRLDKDSPVAWCRMDNDDGAATRSVRDLLDAAEPAREEARRARRLADTQTQADVIGNLRAYARELDGEAFLFEPQAAEFAQKLATTRQLTVEIRPLADEARRRLEQMMDRRKKPE
jgi:hypothetical protein